MHETEQELLDIAGELQDPKMSLQAHHANWGNPFLGTFVDQIRHADAGLAIYDANEHRSMAPQYGGHDAGVCGHIHKAIALWATGYPDSAASSFRDGERLAESLSHPPSLAHYLNQILWLHFFRREWTALEEKATKSIEFSEGLGLPTWIGRSTMLRGYAWCQLGRIEGGLTEIRRGIEISSRGGNMGIATYTAFHADALRLARAYTKAVSTIDSALEMLDTNGEHMWEANAHALKGDILTEAGSVASGEIEACYRVAFEHARRANAKMWELRAATRLARLWQRQGKVPDACELLKPVYNWFTEGFDTADLKEAKALLDELS